jgi:hypothetical protein
MYARAVSKSGIPLGEWSGSAATERLRETIDVYNEKATRQADEMVRLTRQLVVLTWLLAAGLIVQIVLAVAD